MEMRTQVSVQRPKVEGRNVPPLLYCIITEAGPLICAVFIINQLVLGIPASAFWGWDYRQATVPTPHFIYDPGDLDPNL